MPTSIRSGSLNLFMLDHAVIATGVMGLSCQYMLLSAT